MTRLLLGPVLRHIDETSATVWVQTDRACTVEVLGCSARTFQVSGQHYALVVADGLAPASSTEYEVHCDGERVWPPQPSSSQPWPYPPSRIRTLGRGGLKVVFSSCRYPKTEDPKRQRALGVDALDRYAVRVAGLPEQQWPDALLLLGDQVYADEITPATQAWLAARRDLRQPPGVEVVDFDEYAHLYEESWTDPDLRWLLSVVPTAMIFDDHDVRDDWNTSLTWRQQMAAQPWWPGRIRAALASYWVYQHLGNLAPAELAEDATWKAVQAADGDTLPLLEGMAVRADAEVAGAHGIRWSYHRDFGRVRLIMVDTRCGRILAEGTRLMLGEEEFSWVERAAEGSFDHLLIGSSLPWLLPQAIHELQAANEVAAERDGHRGRLAEWIRQAGDLEHWSAFRCSFDRLTRLVRGVASGPDPPATVCVLSGDVHHSYVAEAHFDGPQSAGVYQLTCSPVHNRVPTYLRPLFRLAWSGVLGRASRRWARRAGIDRSPVEWTKLSGPYFGNSVATLELDGRRAVLTLEQPRLPDATLVTVARRSLGGGPRR